MIKKRSQKCDYFTSILVMNESIVMTLLVNRLSTFSESSRGSYIIRGIFMIDNRYEKMGSNVL